MASLLILRTMHNFFTSSAISDHKLSERKCVEALLGDEALCPGFFSITQIPSWAPKLIFILHPGSRKDFQRPNWFGL